MIIFIIACCFIYFIFFHKSGDIGNHSPMVNYEYEWHRRGMHAYLSQSLDNSTQSATYVCHIKFQENFVSSNIPYFNDDNGRFFALSIMNSENNICLAIPINSLNLPRNIDIDIELVVEKHLKNDNNEKIHIPNISKTIYIGNEPFILMEWLEPALVIQSYFALEYNQINQRENWQSEYVKIIKECYNVIIKENQQETQYLKNALKTIGVKNIDIDNAISEYHRRSLFTFVANDVLVSLVDLIIQKIDNNLVNNIYNACNDIHNIGLSLRTDDKYINKAIDILQNYYHNKDNNDNKNKKDRLWALEVLGVPYNATLVEIKKAYRKKMAEVHPDKYQQLPDGIREIIEQKAQEINQAKEILGI